MQFEFYYDEYGRHEMICRAYKAWIKLIVVHGDVESIEINDTLEFEPKDDTLHGLRVLIEAEHYSINQIRLEAEKQFDGLLREALCDIAAENAMENELSSPYLTGRI